MAWPTNLSDDRVAFNGGGITGRIGQEHLKTVHAALGPEIIETKKETAIPAIARLSESNFGAWVEPVFVVADQHALTIIGHQAGAGPYGNGYQHQADSQR